MPATRSSSQSEGKEKMDELKINADKKKYEMLEKYDERQGEDG